MLQILRRFFHSIFVLFGLSVLIFLIARVMPGDPARVALGSFASEEQVHRLRTEMHLDEPLINQYYYWIRGAIRGDFGESLYSGRNVAEDVKEFLPATAELMLFAFLIQSSLGLTLGILSAQYRNSVVDHIARMVSYIGVVTPPFVIGIFLMLIFGYTLNVLPTIGRLSLLTKAPPVITGMITIDGLISGNFAAVLDALRHLLLPGISLAMAGLSQQARITRASMIDNLQKDYIASARAGGIPNRLIMTKYLLKPSFIPTVSVMGLDFAVMLSNAFLVELVFNWGGFSQYAVTAMLFKDLNVITMLVMILGLFFVAMNIIVDLVVMYLDPRIRLT